MDLINNSNYSIILGSGSTRRKELLEMTGISFQVNSIPVNEDFPGHLKAQEIAEQKALKNGDIPLDSIYGSLMARKYLKHGNVQAALEEQNLIPKSQ